MKYSKYSLPLRFCAAALGLMGSASAQQPAKDYAIQPVSFTAVHLKDAFWRSRLETNAKVTIPYILQKCRETGRVDNFLAAAGKIKKDKLTDFPFDDTDLYKVLEGASYSLQESYDPEYSCPRQTHQVFMNGLSSKTSCIRHRALRIMICQSTDGRSLMKTS